MALFDEEGKEVEGALTAEEVTAKVEADKQAAIDAAIDQYKKDNPVAEEKVEVPAVVAPVVTADAALVARIERQERERLADKFAGQDQEKRTQFLDSYNKLSGYPEDDAGVAARAADAVKLAGFVSPGVDVSGVAGTGAGRNADGAGTKGPIDAESPMAKMFGIKKEDAEKYGPAVEAAYPAK